MPEMTNKCPGCRALFSTQDGPTHRHMISSPACWHQFGELLAAEYSSAALMHTHRLSVDAYAVQHPGDQSRQAIQSVGLHLARLMTQLDTPTPPEETNNVMLGFAQRKSTLTFLERPENFTMTIAGVASFIGTEQHAEAVRSWAQSAWDDWHQHHDYIRTWARSL